MKTKHTTHSASSVPMAHSEQELANWEIEFDKKFVASSGYPKFAGNITTKQVKSFISKTIQSEREKMLEDGIEKIKKLESMRWGLASESPTPVWVKLNDVLAKLAQKEKSK